VNIDRVLELFTALAVAYGAYMSRQTQKIAKETQKDVRVVEKATNSMKDALVAATERSAMAEGTASGLAQGRREGQDQREQDRSDEMNRHRWDRDQDDDGAMGADDRRR
jgi:hypothetical protein